MMNEDKSLLPLAGEGARRADEGVADLHSSKRSAGFTLLEILIALFIFSIVSLLLSGALRNIINIQSRTTAHATQLHEVQIALLMMSRDIEQTVNRPVITANGKPEPAFVGTPTSLTFTRGGYVNASGVAVQSSMLREEYFFDNQTLQRKTWPVLDAAPQTLPHSRPLLTKVLSAAFSYLDSKGQFHANWPVGNSQQAVLPRAVKIKLTIENWGEVSEVVAVGI